MSANYKRVKRLQAFQIALEELQNSSFYKSINGFPKYRIGKDGSVWCFRCIHNGSGTAKWKRLKGKQHKCKTRRYVRVHLHNYDREHKIKRSRLVFAHVLVLEAFKGPCPTGKESCHWDDDGLNNNIDNLRWDTRRRNVADAIRNGSR